MLDLRRLQYLEAIYRYRNFTRASEELFVSQSTISVAIKTMEQELGVRLVVRTPKDVTFTYEGEQFLLHARRILRECEEAERKMADLSESKNQALRLGVSPTLGLKLQAFLHSAAFFRQWPKASLYLDEGSMNNHIEKIKQEILDLSYNALPTNPDPAVLKLVRISTDQIFAVMHPDHPLARRDRLSLAELDGMDVVLLDETSRIRGLVMEAFEQEGVVPRIRSSHEQIFCMLNMVKQGSFVGFLNASDTQMSRHLRDSGLVLRALEHSLSFETGFIMKAGKHLPRIAQEIISLAREMETAEGGSFPTLKKDK